VTNGTPLAYEPVHIENFNSLQISNAALCLLERR
jgi:hypothetical protein